MSSENGVDGNKLTRQKLQQITEENDLEKVEKIAFPLDTDNNSISDLSSFLPNLVELKLEAPSFLPNLRKLGSCKNLKILWAQAVGMETLEGTSGLPSLTELFVSYNQIQELGPLAFCSNLEVLDMEGNYVETALELKFLSLCPNLRHVNLSASPLSKLADYRKLLTNRLPKSCTIEDDSQNDTPFMDELSDVNFIKELCAEGVLMLILRLQDEDELLASEPLSRPFTAIGIRPKTGKLTPQSPSASRPRTAINNFKVEFSVNEVIQRPGSASSLTTGGIRQGHRGLFKGRTRARPSSTSSSTTPVTPEDLQKTLDELKNRTSMNSLHSRPSSGEVNVLKLDDMSESADSGIVSATTSISDLSLREDENPIKKVLVRSTRKQDIRSKKPVSKQQQEIIGRPETESGDAKELPQLKAETLPQNFALADARKLVDLNAKPLRTKDLSSLRFQRCE
ncbi:unnamed protein product [Oikopleura dioica]|uniref:Leucine-rich repeat-containing protein 56 n=1 Tax=Oikopleura dioica TaxID=34765 RepID=E4YTK2_OIKDI|nr:unnamed protein product [Oikopleura dioica]